MGNFFNPSVQQLPGVANFQQQLRQLISASQQPLSSGAYGPFASWAAQVGKWLNNPNKQTKNPFESGGGGLFTPWTAPVTAAHGMNVGQIRDAGQNPLVAGQYQPIQQAVTQNALAREGDQYGMNLRGAMQQALGTAMGEFNTVQSENQSGLMSLLGDYGSTLKDVQQKPSLFSQIMQGVGALGPAFSGLGAIFGGAGPGTGAPPGQGAPPSPTAGDVGNPFGSTSQMPLYGSTLGATGFNI